LTSLMDSIGMTETNDLRQKIVAAFLTEPDKHISGTELSRKTGVSRTAVWKHIKALEGLGFRFESTPRIGHRIVHVPDLLLPGIIQPHVPPGQNIGQRVIWYREVDSTNLQAVKWVQEGVPHGTVVTAMIQTGGKGRRGRVWFSPETGLWFSVVFRAPIPVRQAADLTLLTSVAVRRAVIRHTALPIKIKWPNDLLIHDKKVCGILAEIRADGENLDYAIVGVGMNSNIPRDDFPPELSDQATSLLAESGQPVSHVALATDIFAEMDALFTALIHDGRGFESVVEEWRGASATLGRRVRVLSPQGTIEGVATDIDATGVLYVRTDSGTTVPIHSGDVLF
jgi:BirA family transcriptional regulator, biotin operon repressor / biotin---[acetyl-CoA-carboxylase] ligase